MQPSSPKVPCKTGKNKSTLYFLPFLSTKLPFKNIHGITMPAFATTSRTLNNSIKLMKLFGISSEKIDITKACKQHLLDLNHDDETFDITFENTQARERTQILFDKAALEGLSLLIKLIFLLFIIFLIISFLSSLFKF